MVEKSLQQRSSADRGQIASTAAEVYESFFLPALFSQWAGPVLEAARVVQGDHILDVGCGTGVVAREAAIRGAGRVVGLDPNDGMLTVARRTPGIEWVSGSAENIPFDDDAFDKVVSQFAMMFFEDRRQAVREMQRVLKPDGRAVIATWATLEETPGYASMVELLGRLFGEQSANALRAPYNMGDADALVDLLEGAFDDVEVSLREGVARFESIEVWVHTDVRGWTLSGMSDEDYATLLEAAESELARYVDTSGQVAFPAPALIAVATNPR